MKGILIDFLKYNMPILLVNYCSRGCWLLSKTSFLFFLSIALAHSSKMLMISYGKITGFKLIMRVYDGCHFKNWPKRTPKHAVLMFFFFFLTESYGDNQQSDHGNHV